MIFHFYEGEREGEVTARKKLAEIRKRNFFLRNAKVQKMKLNVSNCH